MYCSGCTYRGFYISISSCLPLAWVPVWQRSVIPFGFLPAAAAWLLREVCRRPWGEGRAARKESFLLKCHVPPSSLLSLLFFFFHPLFFKSQMPKKIKIKKCQQTLHFPSGCYPGPLHRLLLISPHPPVRIFPPFFLSVWATVFRWFFLL